MVAWKKARTPPIEEGWRKWPLCRRRYEAGDGPLSTSCPLSSRVALRYKLGMNTQPKVFTSKAEARQYARTLRTSWDADTVTRLGEAIDKQLFRLDCFVEAEALLTYVGAMPGELDTRPLIAAALASGKQVFVPVTKSNGVMAWVPLEGLEALVRTPRGLLEPTQSHRAEVPPPTALCIVPGLLFRADGHRIGFGGGYYDRFLQKHRGTTLALSPAACFAHDYPIASHDIPVNFIVTEDGAFAALPISDE